MPDVLKMSVSCQECGHVYHVKIELAGKNFKCKKCQKVNTIPFPKDQEKVSLLKNPLVYIWSGAALILFIAAGLMINSFRDNENVEQEKSSPSDSLIAENTQGESVLNQVKETSKEEMTIKPEITPLRIQTNPIKYDWEIKTKVAKRPKSIPLPFFSDFLSQVTFTPDPPAWILEIPFTIKALSTQEDAGLRFHHSVKKEVDDKTYRIFMDMVKDQKPPLNLEWSSPGIVGA